MAGFKLGVGIFAAVAAAGTAVFALYKNYQRQMDEAVKAASEAGSEIDENTKSINEQIAKVKELREQLADNSTTQEEAKNIKQELLGIQDSLVEKYGKEAESINLVNGNLEKQIDLLNDLSESQLKDYFKDEENRKGADEAIVAQIEPCLLYTSYFPHVFSVPLLRLLKSQLLRLSQIPNRIFGCLPGKS